MVPYYDHTDHHAFTPARIGVPATSLTNWPDEYIHGTGDDLENIDATFLYADPSGFHFMDQASYETLTLPPDVVREDRDLLVDNLPVQIQKYNGTPIGLQFPPHVELTVTATEPGVRGDTASGGVTKSATLETGLEIRVPLFIKEGEKVKVHTETREFAGRA